MTQKDETVTSQEKQDKKMRKIKSANAVIDATAIGIPIGVLKPESPKLKYPAIKLKSKPAYTYSIN